MSRDRDNTVIAPADHLCSRPRQFSRLLGIGILTIFFATLVGAAISRAGKFLIIDNATPSDLIVVPAGDDGSRLQKAIQLLKDGYANEVIVDAGARQRWLGKTEADRAAAWVASTGDFASHIHVCPVVATSTLTETKDLYRCIHRPPGSRIVVVTSAYHTRRALSTFRSALPQYQWTGASAENTDEFGTRWWEHREWFTTTIHEWEKLLWWEAVERWTA